MDATSVELFNPVSLRYWRDWERDTAMFLVSLWQVYSGILGKVKKKTDGLNPKGGVLLKSNVPGFLKLLLSPPFMFLARFMIYAKMVQ